MNTNEQMSMVVAFPDQSESFVLGFEAGQIWQAIDGEGHVEIDRGMHEGFPIHESNLTVVQRMAAARNYKLEVGEAADGWIPIRLTYQGHSKPGLSIVGSRHDAG